MSNAGMIYGYTRVSTDVQDLTSRLAQLKAVGCEKVFREKITGTTADRPQLQKLMKALARGDIVITSAVDRLSRDATDLLVIACSAPAQARVPLPSRLSIPRPILPSLS
jgi:DNA invertase Pin-like site-specific DNA recombinase